MCLLQIRVYTKDTKKGDVHKNAASRVRDATAAAAGRGGIRVAINRSVSVNRMAVIAALRCMYWIAKNEVPYTTKFEPLLQLAQSLGCEYIHHLHKVVDSLLPH